jgi:PAS domain S-box-containing protein
MDIKGNVIFGTLRLNEIFGWTEEEVMGKISDHIIPENYRMT